MNVSEYRVEEIICSMLGSTHSLDYYLEDDEELTIEQLKHIDDLVGVCDICEKNVETIGLDEYGTCVYCLDYEGY